MDQLNKKWVVIKFGGTSVSSRETWDAVTSIVNARLAAGYSIVIVCSAASQISNQLENMLRLAVSDPDASLLVYQEILNVYRKLAADLEVNVSCCDSDAAALLTLLHQIIDTGMATPPLQAEVMSYGERLLTRLGYAFLSDNFSSLLWMDARSVLKAVHDPNANAASQYLAARCSAGEDPEMMAAFNQSPIQVRLTQGFFASNAKNETVLLGRGGSDVSAAYFAAKLAAERCEIWTDVPGIYTANPQQIPEARQLRYLDYDEAQEIASMGGKVLHPNAVGPLKQAGIPMYINYTRMPERVGTIISSKSDDSGVQIKSVLTKHQLLVISIKTVRMWQQVGFLADVFACFKRQGLSIDLITTSELSVTVSLDHTPALADEDVLDRLLAELNQFTVAEMIGPCASVSIVGHNIRTILHQLGSVFSVFESQQVHMVSQADNDLNLTFVVDESQVNRLAAKLHTLLIDQHPHSQYLSLRWQEEFGDTPGKVTPWWETEHQALLDLMRDHRPKYVYSEAVIQERSMGLLSCNQLSAVFYAIKANSHPEILRQLYRNGMNFECVSIHEVEFIFELFPEISSKRILFTPNFAPKSEYVRALSLGVNLTIDNLFPLVEWPEIFKAESLIFRIDPGHGSGHHRFVVTGGDASKFGIPVGQCAYAKTLADAAGAKVIGLHVHSGSGILQADNWKSHAALLSKLMVDFPDVNILNLGGGLGIVERSGQHALDLSALNNSLAEFTAQGLSLWLEPGRYVVAESGVLLATVTQIKAKGKNCYIGIDTGMNSLIRPALYGAYHEIVNLSKLNQPKTVLANIVGPICESGDTLGYARMMPEAEEGDIILIANTGAYGHVMSSQYNLRQPAEEYYLPKESEC